MLRWSTWKADPLLGIVPLLVVVSFVVRFRVKI